MHIVDKYAYVHVPHFADDIVIVNHMVGWWYSFIQICDMLSAILNNFVGLI